MIVEAMAEPAPWTVLSSQVSFSDPWLRVRSDHCLTGEGDVLGPFHVIEYPDWVTIVPLTRNQQRLIMVREYCHGVRAVLTGLPGGVVDPADGTDRLLAARVAAERELLEETGHYNGQFELLASLHPNPSNQTNTVFCFLATGLVRAGRPQLGGPGEVQEVVERELADVLDELRRGEAPMHAVHAAALWSAAGRIVADRSGRFGCSRKRLRRLLTGEAARCPGPPEDEHHLALLTVGG